MESFNGNGLKGNPYPDRTMDQTYAGANPNNVTSP